MQANNLQAKHKYMVGIMMALGLAACSTPPHRTVTVVQEAQPSYRVLYGRVVKIERVDERQGTSGAGAVVGGVVGGVVGNQIGNGSGRDLATVAGVVGGAIVGNEVEKHNRNTSTYYRVTVRLSDGSERVVQQTEIGDMRVGDRVRIEREGVSRY